MLVKGIRKRTRTTTEFVTSIYPKLLHKEKYHWKQQKYLPKEKTPFMTGFKSREGNDFSSRLVLTENLDISFDNTLCKCPKCGGNLYINKKAYNCSNYRNESHKM